LVLPGGWMMLKPRQREIVRVVDYDEKTITLKLKRPEYALEFARLNNVGFKFEN
jgi:hypothetical protein